MEGNAGHLESSMLELGRGCSELLPGTAVGFHTAPDLTPSWHLFPAHGRSPLIQEENLINGLLRQALCPL